MNPRRIHVVGLLGLLAFGLIGCGFISSGEEVIQTKQTYLSRCRDKEIHFPIPDKDVPGYPTWRPGSPIPLTIDQAINTGMKELPKYTKGLGGWEFNGVSLSALHSDGPVINKWVYLIQFQQKGHPNLLEIPIALNGAPIQGNEQPLDKHRWSN